MLANTRIKSKFYFTVEGFATNLPSKTGLDKHEGRQFLQANSFRLQKVIKHLSNRFRRV
jgi:hypothetical protein